jgi:hypothetical protein
MTNKFVLSKKDYIVHKTALKQLLDCGDITSEDYRNISSQWKIGVHSTGREENE